MINLTNPLYSLTKEGQSKTSKQQREELSNLRRDLADARETMKLKEAKNGMTQARLRNQIKQFEKENLNLKNEVEKLTREMAKLNARQKNTPRDNKILMEINKNVTKLAQEKKQEKNKLADASKLETSDTNDGSLTDLSNFRDFSFVNVEKRYQDVFESNRNCSLNDSKKSGKFKIFYVFKRKFDMTDKVERFLTDGSKEIKYNDGKIKIVSPDGNLITVKYVNGDQKRMSLIEGTVRYFYSEKNITQTTYPDGCETIEYPE